MCYINLISFDVCFNEAIKMIRFEMILCVLCQRTTSCWTFLKFILPSLHVGTESAIEYNILKEWDNLTVLLT